MLLSTRLKLVVALWATAEVLVFLAVVHLVGLGGALLAGLAATLLGGWLLKRTGAAAVLRLRATVSGRGESAPGEILDGTVRALAALALLLPGFLSDAIGLALAIPAVRAAAIRRMSGRDWTRRRFGEPGSRPRAGSDRSRIRRVERVAAYRHAATLIRRRASRIAASGRVAGATRRRPFAWGNEVERRADRQA